MRRNKQNIPVPSSASGQKNNKVSCDLVSATELLDKIKSDKTKEDKNSRDCISDWDLPMDTYPV